MYALRAEGIIRKHCHLKHDPDETISNHYIVSDTMKLLDKYSTIRSSNKEVRNAFLFSDWDCYADEETAKRFCEALDKALNG